MDDLAARFNRGRARGLRFPCLAPHRLNDFAERFLHVRRLPGLMLGPFPMKTQHRDAPLVLHRRIKFAERVVVRNHLAPAGEAHEGPIIAARVCLELLAVAAAIDTLEATGRAHPGHAAA